MFLIFRRTALALLVGLPLVIIAQQSRADAPGDAAGFVNQLVNRALGVLQDKNLSEAERERTFSQLLTENFDIPRMSRFVLGRYWAGASEEERKHFIDTYRDFIIRSYATRFAGYNGETVKVTKSRSESDNVIIVNSEIIHPSGDPPVEIAWRVFKGSDGYKIVDVDVEGVSMMITQREEFASVIQRSGGSVTGLTQAIQQKMQSSGPG